MEQALGLEKILEESQTLACALVIGQLKSPREYVFRSWGTYRKEFVEGRRRQSAGWPKSASKSPRVAGGHQSSLAHVWKVTLDAPLALGSSYQCSGFREAADHISDWLDCSCVVRSSGSGQRQSFGGPENDRKTAKTRFET